MVELIAFEEGVDRGATAMVADPIDAGMFINLQHSPTFLMIPEPHVLHGTMYTGHASGRGHF